MEMNACKAADLLNEMLIIDHSGTRGLLSNLVPCNQELADHPTVQVRAICGNNFVGFLGVLNGMLLRSESADVVVAVWDECDDLVRFETKPYSECIA